MLNEIQSLTLHVSLRESILQQNKQEEKLCVLLQIKPSLAIKYSGRRNLAAVTQEEVKHKFEDDNRLIGGNSDNGGLANVDNNWSDNHNDNVGFRPLIAAHCLTVLIQPPIILPISTSWEDRSWYLLLSIHFVSQESRINIFRRSSLMLTF